jgi:hypothetical protein
MKSVHGEKWVIVDWSGLGWFSTWDVCINFVTLFVFALTCSFWCTACGWLCLVIFTSTALKWLHLDSLHIAVELINHVACFSMHKVFSTRHKILSYMSPVISGFNILIFIFYNTFQCRNDCVGCKSSPFKIMFISVKPDVICHFSVLIWSRNSSVGIVKGYQLDGLGSNPGRDKRSVLHSVHTSSGPHPVSYPVGTRGSYPRSKVARAWSWPLTSI